FRTRPRTERGSPADSARRPRLQPQGGRRRQRLALLLADADADDGYDRARRTVVRGARPELDGPRVRHELPRAAADRLGLVLDSTGRRTGPDDLPPAPGRRLHRSALERHPRRSGWPHGTGDARERLHAHAGPDMG